MSAEAAAAGPAPTRAQVWKWLGAPTDQVGSVNDPRTQVDFGCRWNEKWVYRGEDGETVEKLVLWHRYDFAGAFTGEGQPLELAEPAA